MALHSKLDFIALCKIDHAYLKTYVKRGKIIEKNMGGKPYYDDTNFLNAAFIKKRVGATVEVVEQKKTEPIIELDLKNRTPPKSASTSLKNEDMYELDVVKKKVQIKKINEDFEAVKLKNAKTRGEVIPSELMEPFLVQNNQSILTEFKNAVDEILRIFAHKRTLSVLEVAEIKGELVPIINHAVQKATDNTLKQIKNMITDYSESKGNG